MDNLETHSSWELLFTVPKKLKFLNKKFDFEISPDKFIEWLRSIGEEITGNYRLDCTTMCEYSCLYIAIVLSDIKLKGEMLIYYGKFGFFEHYWIGYKIDNQEYFIDLTLQQFDKSAPKLAITKYSNERVSGSYSFLSEGEPIKDYLERMKNCDLLNRSLA